MATAIPAKLIEDVARELTSRAAIDIPEDYRQGVIAARDREDSRIARFVLDESESAARIIEAAGIKSQKNR